MLPTIEIQIHLYILQLANQLNCYWRSRALKAIHVQREQGQTRNKRLIYSRTTRTREHLGVCGVCVCSGDLEFRNKTKRGEAGQESAIHVN